MVKKTFLSVVFILLFVLISSTIVLAESDCLYYFYGEESCPSCERSSVFLDNLQQKYPDLNVENKEVYFSFANFQLLEDYFVAYGLEEEKRGVPAVFLHGSYFVGENAITEMLENRIQHNKVELCPQMEDEAVGVVGESNSHRVLSILTFPVLTNNSLLDSVKTFGLALLMVLLLIFAYYPDGKGLKLSSFFILGISFAYLLNALGWFFSLPTTFFADFVAVVGILVGVLLLINFLRGKPLIVFKKDETEEKEKTTKKKYEQYLMRFTSWHSFFLGVILALFTIPSLGEKYVVLSGLLVNQYNAGSAFFLTIYYIILVLLIPTLLIYLAAEILGRIHRHADKKEKKDLWRKHNIGLFHFVLSIVQIVLGMVILLL